MRTRYAAIPVMLGALSWTVAEVRPPALSVVIVTLDTTRSDRLTPYGLMDHSMPSLERLAREGTVFDQAISVSPLTLPAHSTLFTGLVPPRHGVRDNADEPLAPSQTTLAEVLRTQGFRTAGFVASAVLDSRRGLAQGFETYSGVPEASGHGPAGLQRRADAVVDEASAWMRQVGRERFFLWTHLYDPHRPYDPPGAYGASADLYTGEIAFAASQVGRLLDTLEQRGLLDRTIVVVAGDHGESLGEHGETDHGIFLYDGVVRVPLMIRVPGARPRRVPEVVRLTDIVPTVLDLLGLPAHPVDGVSLAGLVRGESAGLDLDAYSESLYPLRFGWSGIYALRDSRFKFIDAPKPELYDLAADPFERRNIVDERPAVASAMRQRARVIASSGRPAGPVPGTALVPPDIRERLAALGYTAGGMVRLAPETTGLPDPKDCIASGGSQADAARLSCGRGTRGHRDGRSAVKESLRPR